MKNFDKDVLKEYETFLDESKNELKSLLDEIGWSHVDLESIKVQCKYDKDHFVHKNGIEQHEKKCFMKQNGWTNEEYEAIPEITLKPVASNLLDQDELVYLEEKIGNSIQSDKKVEELLSQVRDIKHRRQTYRVHKTMKSQTEIHREIIGIQMQFLKELQDVQRDVDEYQQEDKTVTEDARDRSGDRSNKRKKKKKEKKKKKKKSKKHKKEHKNDRSRYDSYSD